MRILIVDDHTLIREALCATLKILRDDAVVVEAVDYRQAIVSIEERPDFGLVLLDLNLPDCDGLNALAELRKSHPEIPIVVLSAMNDRDNVARALNLGAMGFIPKSASREIMMSALRLIFAGGIYIPPDILDGNHPSQIANTKQTKSTLPASPSDIGLTGRQTDVLSLMMQGMGNKAICRALNLAEPTVKNHITAILKALKVTNRTEAVIAVAELGWNLKQTSNP